MRKLLAVLVMCLVASNAYADTQKLVDLTKSIVNYTKPGVDYGAFMSFKDVGDLNFSSIETFRGLSGSVLSFDTTDEDGIEHNLGNWRVGGVFEGNQKIYTVLQANVITLARLYLPEDVKSFMSPGPMDKVWDVVDKYGAVGIGPGLDDLDKDFHFKDDIGIVTTIGLNVRF